MSLEQNIQISLKSFLNLPIHLCIIKYLQEKNMYAILHTCRWLQDKISTLLLCDIFLFYVQKMIILRETPPLMTRYENIIMLLFFIEIFKQHVLVRPKIINVLIKYKRTNLQDVQVTIPKQVKPLKLAN